MNRWKKYIVTSLMLLLVWYVLPQAGWAVSPEEIQQIEQAAPDKARVQPAQPRKLLVFSLTLGFQHSSIPYVEKALEVMGQKTGAFAVTTSTDMNVFQPDSLNQFEGLPHILNALQNASHQPAAVTYKRNGKFNNVINIIWE
mgnify:CR=1 FL=1